MPANHEMLGTISMSNYGVIDLGSNTVRLVIFEVQDNWDGTRPVSGKIIRSIMNDKVMAGLSAYTKDGEFSGAGIVKAIDVLKGHLKRARYFNCKRIDIFATAVLRNCTNSSTALAVIESTVGQRINLLSAQDEAHLSFVGASCDKSIDTGVLIDLGGGSCELVKIKDGKDVHNTSIPQGCLSSYAQYVRYVIPQQPEAQLIADSFLKLAGQVENFADFKHPKLYAVGGSARAAAKLYAAAQEMDQRPKLLTSEHIDYLLRILQEDPALFSHLASRAVPERLHTVGPGCIILSELMRMLGASTIELCKRGVREGYLIERMLCK